MDDITFGAIIPVYNTEQYLRECLNSIVNQKSPFKDIIIVNDGSTDSSKYICEEYSIKYSNITLINQTNQGQATARNVGLNLTKSDYAVFVDSDDYVDLSLVESLRKIIRRKNEKIDAVFYGGSIIDELGKEYNIRKNQYYRNEDTCGHILSGLEFFNQSFPNNYIVSPCLAAYKVSFLREKNISFPKGKYFEDIFFYLYTVCNAKFVICMKNCLYIRRYRDNSTVTGKWTGKKSEDLATIYMLCWKYIKSTFSTEIIHKIFQSYIAKGMLEIIARLTDANDIDSVPEVEQAIDLFLSFGWKQVNDYSFCELGVLLIVLKQLEKYQNLISYYYGNYINYKEIHDKTNKLFYEILISKLGVIPFGEKGKRIGIYGIGKHTMYLLNYYQEYIGNIEAETYFIVSDSEHAEMMEGRKVINYKEIKRKDDIFVVSSRIYQDEMIANLKSKGIEKNKIIKLYEKNDFYDLTFLNKIFLYLDRE